MRKVCIVRQGFFPLDVRVRKEAIALADKGYMVDVICLVGPNKEYEKRTDSYHGINIHRLSMGRSRGGLGRYLYEYVSFFIVAKAKLCLLHFRNRYDIIQVNTLPDFLIFVTLLPKLFGAKTILDLHEPAPELFGSIFGKNKKFMIKILKLIEKVSILYSDRVITVSEEMKQNYIRRGAKGSKISVILNVPNLEFKAQNHGEYYQKSNNRFSLMCHGAILKRYGHEVVIKAINLLKNEIPTIHLDITGSGDSYESEMKKLVKDLGLEDKVTFHGFIAFSDVIKMLANADIGIVPVERNPYSDLVHTNKMFECIAMKKPVIITRTKAVEDFFGSDDSCLKYFESGNEKDLAMCILELYKNPKKMENMARNAFDRFYAVRWETLKEEYCKLFV